MPSEIYWVDGPWSGKLAIAPRPRGGDWLEDDVANWKRAGINEVLSLLTRDEERELQLLNEGSESQRAGIQFLSLPIPDRQVPPSEAKFTEALTKVSQGLSSGKNVLVHCRQGVGRAGMIAACLLVRTGMSPGAAVETVSAARGIVVPETIEQREWIERHAPAIME